MMTTPAFASEVKFCESPLGTAKRPDGRKRADEFAEVVEHRLDRSVRYGVTLRQAERRQLTRFELVGAFLAPRMRAAIVLEDRFVDGEAAVLDARLSARRSSGVLLAPITRPDSSKAISRSKPEVRATTLSNSRIVTSLLEAIALAISLRWAI